ncbi:hypothetical protein RCH06_000879 [Polaromonas sp. CG_9.5]|uniref:SPOR domain-containing protein n=1 Tax=Polaromonas sp. CG_9.5 TaxID=3071705 RepID=UPI002DFC1D93|nr:hypothetical protein [Polaromonas sp. CG_9.5]
MLKILVLVLLLANGAYFALGHGWLGAYGFVRERVAEPERLAQQIRPEAMQLATDSPQAPPSQPAPAGKTPRVATAGTPLTPPAPLPPGATQCLQVGMFTEHQARALRLRLHNGLPANSWSFESSGDSARWIIYMGKYISKDAMNRKRVKLEQLGLTFEPPISPLLNPGLSLGSFASKADAENVLAQMEQRGLRSAKVILERPELPSLWLRLPAADASIRAKLDALKPYLLDKAVQACS